MALIYAVEDDKNILEIEMFALKNSGYQVDGFECARDFYKKLDERQPDLVLLDIMLPDEDGLEIVGKLRRRPETKKLPVIMVTAKTTEIDKVKGLDVGADDYLTKPFSVAELLARVRVALRRVAFDETEEEAGETYRIGDLAIDFDAKVVVRGDDEIHLTPIEYKLLVLLARNTGKVLTHNYILKEVWGQALTSDLPSLRVFMATLRKKIEPDPASPVYLQTHVGIGYRMLRVE